MHKRTFYTELAYFIGLLLLAFGAAVMEYADCGMSMVVAPAYLLHLKISQYLPFFSFGMAEYTVQTLLLIVTMLFLRKVKLSYFFSFVTAILYGFILDGTVALIGLLPPPSFAVRIIFYIAGVFLGSFGVSLLFHTYISPQAYELFVKELSGKYNIDIHKFKTVYDCASCLVGILLSFAFFGLWHFEGVKLGTVLCALVNGYIISRCTKFYEKHWTFKDGLSFRKYF